MNNPVSIQELEAIWRQRVQEAKLRYDLAMADAEKAASLATDTPSPSREYDAMLAARREYMRVVKILDDLVVDGTIPQE